MLVADVGDARPVTEAFTVSKMRGWTRLHGYS